MAKVKSNNPTIDSGLLTKTHTYTDLIDNEAFIFFPDKDNWRKRLIYTLEKWCEKEDSVELQQFYDEYKIPRQTMVVWRNKHADINKALDTAKLTMGSRRRIGALTRKFDREVVFRDMHVYDDEWLAINKYNVDLKKDETHVPTTFILPVGPDGRLKKPEVITQEQMESNNDQSL